ncbi:autotransporter domain-containing protein [Stenotrophomonas sp. C3(2023)]|uniref:autotransporter family protein n=1 Tax=Stenotrophomonas sp. C3(2023) TaxID=3080277 RepID=UPI00293C83A6|nr:autotransporter domain-containing protein [Stenotrophomonas sp. C3(2023)]MDV3467539.1 autotransporter domain-containing protein [Stenotrophomonas sp. C3(2023)]
MLPAASRRARLSLAILAALPLQALADCSPVAPVSGQTVTCTPDPPNPSTTPIRPVAGAADVVVTVQSGAELRTSGAHAIAFGAGGSGVIDNAGTIAAGGGAWAALTSGSVLTVSNAATGVLQSLQDRALLLTAGSQLINAGSIQSGAGPGVLFSGTGNSQVIDTGTIVGPGGGIVFGGGNDLLDMQAGSVGAVSQGAGADMLLLSGGTLASVDQGDGDDSMVVTGGTVIGTVQQGNGVDRFEMSGGTLGALLQGDNYDYFRMTGGRIIGAFEDGDYAEMTGGRIGRVNLKLDNNVFDMSGGTIDGNLVAGFGNDTIILSEGYIGGNISVSGGDDSVTITGGTVRGEVRLSFGQDRFEWNGGGVVYGLIDLGEGDDSARLANLNQSHLGALPGLDGGLGDDVLLMDNVKATGVDRFTGWEQIELRNDTQLTFDGRLLLGDAGSGTGTLQVDAGSALFASGTVGGIAAFGSGALANVINAGRIDLSSNGSAGDRFTIVGNYTGNGGGLYLNTVLGDDSSASDRLLVEGGRIAGQTGIGILNAGGTGAATTLDGIMVVQALNGATSTADAFALFNPISVGAYEYFLFKGGVSAGTGENWYLRSTLVASVTPAPAPVPTPTPPVPAPVPAPPEDLGAEPVDLPPAPPPPPDVPTDPEAPDPDPIAAEPAPPAPPPEPPPVPAPTVEVPPPVPDTPAVLPTAVATPPTPGARAPRGEVVPIYRLETPAYAVLPSLLRTVSQASLGTFQERQGEQRLLAGQGGLRGAWARLVGSSEQQHWQGDALTGFDGDLQGLQAGVDLYASTDGALHHQLGVFAGRTRAVGRITGLALGWENVQVGQTRLDDKHVGLAWTLNGGNGGYLDAVVLQSRYRGKAWSTRGLGIDLRGDGTTASVEVGKPLLRFGQSAWWLEPQLQVIWQQQDLDDAADAVAAIRFGGDAAWTGRAGLRLAADYGLADNGWQPYFKLNYWTTLSGDDHIDFDDNRILAGQRTRAWEVGAGVVGRFNRTVSAYAVADYTRDLENQDRRRRSVQGTVGLRLDW